jgi:hypothetical protein
MRPRRKVVGRADVETSDARGANGTPDAVLADSRLAAWSGPDPAPAAADDEPARKDDERIEEPIMNRSAFAAARPGASSPQAAGTGYEPGVCNIGPDEIARRRRAGHIGLGVTLIVFAALVAVGAPPLARLLLAIPAAGAAAGYVQAWSRFCAGFGSRGVFNLGPIGEAQQVVDAAARRQDLAKATQITLASLAIGVVVGVVAVLLPI